MPRKFKIGDIVRVKQFKVKCPDDEDVENTMGKTGEIQSYSSGDWYPYNVVFDDPNLEDMPFKASELEKAKTK